MVIFSLYPTIPQCPSAYHILLKNLGKNHAREGLTPSRELKLLSVFLRLDVGKALSHTRNVFLTQSHEAFPPSQMRSMDSFPSTVINFYTVQSAICLSACVYCEQLATVNFPQQVLLYLCAYLWVCVDVCKLLENKKIICALGGCILLRWTLRSIISVCFL